MVSGVIAASTKKHPASKVWLQSGVVLTAAGFGVQLTGFRQGADFNHNDAFHVSQIAALYLFFQGARLLEDVSPRLAAPSAHDKSNRRSG